MIQARNLSSFVASIERAESRLSQGARQTVQGIAETFLEDVEGSTPPPPWNPGYPDREPTGALGRAFHHTETKSEGENGARTTIQLKPDAPPRVRKRAYAHEYGMIIHAKNAPYMVFRDKDGSWVKRKTVKMKEKRYFRNAHLSLELHGSMIAQSVIREILARENR